MADGQISKSESNYRKPKDDWEDGKCEYCIYFEKDSNSRKNGTCTLVKGKINPHWTCDLFARMEM